MKKLTSFIFLVVFVLFLLNLHACTVTPPSFSSQPVPTATPFTGTINVNDVSTGSCPVKVWLDSAGPITVTAGSIHTFTNVNPGAHNLTFVTTASTSCGAGAVTCYFSNYGNGGYSCSFYLNSNQVETASITDNGCNQMQITNPY